ncbi:hypothetical protein E2I00_004250 [Balaenoptera physalus]|uniref:Prostaglandin E synthase n=1 Tax=Balaenoptera physalus TaxID=9770 RepID=A0A6A1QJ32_BALPH|nr:hypothetical protein E2I00_004250 [Balaenoptera physalus]
MPPPGLELMSGRVLPAFLLCSALLMFSGPEFERAGSGPGASPKPFGMASLRPLVSAGPAPPFPVLRAFTICCATRLLPTLRMLRDTEASSIAGVTRMWNVVSGKAHRNDMETIYPFLFLGFVYSFLGPDPFVAWMHFLVVFLGRMVHTVAYLGRLRAPTRSLAYTLAQLPCASMALQIVWEAARHL